MAELVLTVALMFLVVGMAARWAMRHGLRERFTGGRMDDRSNGGVG